MRRFLLACAVLTALLAAAGCTSVPAASTEPEPTTVPTEPSTTAHVHAYDRKVVAPTCTEEGYAVFTCACGDSYTGEETAALDHDEELQVREASAEAPGATVHTCRRCGYSFEDQFTWLAETSTDFFDDAAFIGDSITMGLRNYNYKYNLLGKATFLCQGSYSVNHAVNDSMYITYRGEDRKPQNALADCGAKKVFILLGMNDIGLHGVEKTIENWGKFIANLREKCPDIEIYIQSGTPIYTAGQIGGLNNARMDEYNEKLKAFAEENSCHFIDIATALKDENGGLAAEYASDAYVHLTFPACNLWIQLLKNYVGQ